MFTGFTPDTAQYLNRAALSDGKSAYESLKPLYARAVRAPLLALHEELLPTVLRIDPAICARPARCVSGAFNDMRFSPQNPLKTYLYLHFVAERGRPDNLPGFFMDADARSFRYGLTLYHATPAFMNALRREACDAPRAITDALQTALRSGHAFAWTGDVYRRDRYASVPEPLHAFLAQKRWCLACTPSNAAPLYTPALIPLLQDAFTALAPLYAWLAQ